MTRSTWLKVGFVLLIVVGVVGGLRAFGVDLTQVTPERVRAFVLRFGVWAPLIYVLAYGQPIVPLPASLMTGLAGVAFGKGLGTLAAVVGASLRACTEFVVARWLGRDVVAKLLRGKVAAFDQKLGNNSFKTVLLVRLIPNFPFDIQNYGLGFSKVRFGPYMLATFLGILPGSFVFVYAGYSLTNPKQLWKLLLAILLIAGLMAGTSRWKRRQAAASRP